MDSELKQHLEAMEARMTERIDASEARLEGRIDASEERLREFISKADTEMETKFLTAFHKWGSTSDMRTRQALDNVIAFTNG